MFSRDKTSPVLGFAKKALVGGAIAKALSSDEKKESSGFLKKALIGGALGGLAFYFFDPNMGRTRRAKVRDKLVKLKTRTSKEIDQKQRYLSAQAEGLQARAGAAVTADSPPPSDEALHDKIESEVLTRHKYPKGQVTLEVVDGVVTLRGQLKRPDDIGKLEQDVRKVSGVVDVRNFLHLPGQEPPNKEEALRAGS